MVFNELAAIQEGRSALAGIFKHACSSIGDVNSEKKREVGGTCNLLNRIDWIKQPPLLCCLTKLLKSVDSKDYFPSYVIEAISALCLGSLLFCVDGKRLVLHCTFNVAVLLMFYDSKVGLVFLLLHSSGSWSLYL